MYNVEPNLIISNTDLQRLLPVLDLHDTPASEALATELHRAVIVEPHAMPDDVVSMNSEVVYEDLDSKTRRTVTLVYPKDADATRGRISVLAPVGSALLGLRVGQTISWKLPTGTRRICVVEVRPSSATA